MKSLNKKDIINMIDQSSEELHQKIDNHRSLISSILEEGISESVLKRVTGPFPSGSDGKLKEAVKETIDVLEQTKKAFKSKRLEALRKKLIQVLIDSEKY